MSVDDLYGAKHYPETESFNDHCENEALLKVPWVNHEGQTNIVWPCPEVAYSYALLLEEPYLGIEFEPILDRDGADRCS